METVKVSSKGQIVIPKEMREAQGITAGTQFVVSAVGDEIRLRPAPLFAPSTHAQAAGCLRRKGRKAPTDAQMKAAVRARAKRLDDAAKTG
ncbi:MAG TPA: AbrB/MazE/SpoVT family DNA-binding domain-containing protein [Burkholderiales bacterium]|nr:AbrB/MazE/SpoVT family DNA-binding domain-containing protein [Burkholderiales bacterium]